MCEYMVTSLWNPSKVSVDSFLLNNGHSYHVAHLVGILEYILETRYFPSTSSSSFYFLTFIRRRQWIRYLGLLLVVGGQIVRSLAMIHASHSFSHHIAYKKKDDHSLVTTGIYAYSRHPSYAGFFWWAVGTQLLLGNSFATFAFALFLWRWFFARIGEEERLLVRFFGDEYVKYREKVLSGLPLLR
ncbi:Isoprenylcysteine carboxyl methyltransferase family-domain-containing protein [Mrakia frigida]|uniref:protein-S-isoprenylcysteine carboxyl O-methyltransferase n=1 Tax=Mrakia frigida TaxID=29902 RepID=UPI003FCBFAA0